MCESQKLKGQRTKRIKNLRKTEILRGKNKLEDCFEEARKKKKLLDSSCDEMTRNVSCAQTNEGENYIVIIKNGLGDLQTAPKLR